MLKREHSEIVKRLSSWDGGVRKDALGKIRKMEEKKRHSLHKGIALGLERIRFLAVLNEEMIQAFVETHPDPSTLKRELMERLAALGSERVEKRGELERLTVPGIREGDRALERALRGEGKRGGLMRRARAGGYLDLKWLEERLTGSILSLEKGEVIRLMILIRLYGLSLSRGSRIMENGEMDRLISRYLKERGRDPRIARPLWRGVREGFGRIPGLPEFPLSVRAALDMALGEGGDLWMRREAMAIICRLDPFRGLDVAVRILEHGDDPFLHSGALRALLQIPEGMREGVREVLTSTLERERSPHVRGAAVEVASKMGRGGAEILLRVMSGDPSADLRARALIALSNAPSLGEGERLRLLLRCLKMEEDPLVKRACLEEVERLSPSIPAAQGVVEPFLKVLSTLSREPGLPLNIRRSSLRAGERIFLSTIPGMEGLRALLEERVGKARIRPCPDRPYRAGKVVLGRGEIPVPHEIFRRYLALMGASDIGLSLDEEGERLALYRGDSFRMGLARVVHEALHPSPLKRRGYLHTLLSTPSGPVRFPPHLLSELTPPSIPSSRPYHENEEGWRSFIPTVEDYIFASSPFRSRRVEVYTEGGRWLIVPPSPLLRRMRAYLDLSLSWKGLCDMRESNPGDPAMSGVRAFLRTMDSKGFETSFLPHPSWGDRSFPPPWIEPLLPSLIPLSPLLQWTEGAASYFTDLESDPISSLLLFCLLFSSLLLTRNLLNRRDFERARRGIPLFISGWGTRGKSSVERLKAAVLHAAGFDVVCRTTGTKPSLLFTSRGGELLELDLFRPSTKPSIWEQVSTLRTFSSPATDVFLSECMAVRPDYARILQDWTRDDFITITNTYLDHEDVQGPQALDVTVAMKDFFPDRGTVITSEEEMAPLLQELAAVKGVPVRRVGWREYALLPGDLLKGFPYPEHPKNVALVVKLMGALGIEEDFTLWAMAHALVPDPGAAKVYPAMPFEGRWVEFICGMSANDPVSFHQTVRTFGLDTAVRGEGGGEWLVVLSNARGDRVPRARAFASLLTGFPSDRIIATGDGAGIFLEFLKEEFRKGLAHLRNARGWEGARGTLHRVLDRFRIRRGGGDGGGGDESLFEEISMLERASIRGGEGWKGELEALLWRIFDQRVCLEARKGGDPSPILRRAVEMAPPGKRVKILAVQNIRGVGMELVNLFKSWENMMPRMNDLFSSSPGKRGEALRYFSNFPFREGILLEGALEAIMARASGPSPLPAEVTDAMGHLRKMGEAVRAKKERRGGRVLAGLASPFNRARARRLARKVSILLSMGLISSERACDLMKGAAGMAREGR